jgi:hypothetical protein
MIIAPFAVLKRAELKVPDSGRARNFAKRGFQAMF